MNAEKWVNSNIKELTEKNILITGANSGLGLETSKFLSRKGANIIMACRNTEKGEKAKKQILEKYPEAKLEVRKLNLASLQSIKDFSKAFLKDYNELHVLCNNAGVMALPESRTEDNLEMQFGTNHIGHFALTALLFPLLKNTKNSRIVNISSELHKYGKMNFSDLQAEKKYSKWKAYNQSKLANMLFTYELQRKIEANNIAMLSLAAHPGYASTNLQTAGAIMSNARIKEKLSSFGNLLFAQSQEMGALPSILAIAGEEVSNGDFYGPGGFMNMRGFPKKVPSSKRSHNKDDAKRLWEISEKLSGIDFTIE